MVRWQTQSSSQVAPKLASFVIYLHPPAKRDTPIFAHFPACQCTAHTCHDYLFNLFHSVLTICPHKLHSSQSVLTTSSSFSCAGAGVDATGLSVTGGQTMTSIKAELSTTSTSIHRDILQLDNQHAPSYSTHVNY